MSTAPDRWAWSPLGQMLVNDKLLSTEQLNQALERQRKTRERLGQILIDMKLIDEDMLLKYLGAQFRKESITRQDLAGLDPEVVKLVPEEVARQYGVIASQRSGRKASGSSKNRGSRCRTHWLIQSVRPAGTW